jgi:hypothetical protein
MSYLFVGAGVVGVEFVGAGVVVSASLLQPVSIMPIARPNSTIRVCIRFIIGVTFTKNPKRTRKIF